MPLRSSSLSWFSTPLRIAAVLFSAGWILVALNCRSPYLLRYRDELPWSFAAVGLVAMLVLLKRGEGLLRLAAVGVVAGALISCGIQWKHDRNRRLVRATSPGNMPEIGKHLMIGWLGREETRALAIQGGIAGVYLTNRNFPAGTSSSDIRRVVDGLQEARDAAGLPRLWIATDQEGGVVSRLSPPLKPQPGLGSLLVSLDGPGLWNDPVRAEKIVRLVTDYAEVQGKALAEAGINMNFAPVVDLKPASPPGRLDFHSQISTRALAKDAEVVALAGETYARTLARHGVLAVLKHFPGLGRIPADTHHFSVRMDTPVAELETSDWVPFRRTLQRTNAAIMLGHVRLAALDRERNASSSPMVTRLLREDWGFKGLLVTDDFSMAPVSHGKGGIVRAARESMAAGVDLILLSYDAEAVYDLLGRSCGAVRTSPAPGTDPPASGAARV